MYKIAYVAYRLFLHGWNVKYDIIFKSVQNSEGCYFLLKTLKLTFVNKANFRQLSIGSHFEWIRERLNSNMLYVNLFPSSWKFNSCNIIFLNSEATYVFSSLISWECFGAWGIVKRFEIPSALELWISHYLPHNPYKIPGLSCTYSKAIRKFS